MDVGDVTFSVFECRAHRRPLPVHPCNNHNTGLPCSEGSDDRGETRVHTSSQPWGSLNWPN